MAPRQLMGTGKCHHVVVRYDSSPRLLVVSVGLRLPVRTPQRRNKRISLRPIALAVSMRSWWRRSPITLPPLSL